jgi:glycosyltransferase involved in cell wall biosynthesis
MPGQDMHLSIVVSVYNEEEALETFWADLKQELGKIEGIMPEVIFVNDGSTDRSEIILKSICDRENPAFRVRAIHFSRNFGHEAAMIAGIDASTAGAIICMDADLQHPPAKIGQMVQAFLQGYDIVTMTRSARQDGGWLKRLFSRIFYRFINRLSPIEFQENASDFFLISGRVAAVLKREFRERTRLIRGIIQVVGFPRTSLEFVAPKRVGGRSKYSFGSLMSLTVSAVIAYSKLPLYIGLVLGALFALFSVAVGIYSLVVYIFFATPPPGYTTLILFVSLAFSILFFLIGIIGVYIGFTFEENRQRPIYITREKTGF